MPCPHKWPKLGPSLLGADMHNGRSSLLHSQKSDVVQSCTNDFYWEEFKEFVSNIKWRIKYEIPETEVVLKCVEMCSATDQTIVDNKS